MLWRKIYKFSFVKRSLLSGLSKTDHHFFDPCRNRKRGPKILTHYPMPWPWATQPSPGPRASWRSSVCSLSIAFDFTHPESSLQIPRDQLGGQHPALGLLPWWMRVLSSICSGHLPLHPEEDQQWFHLPLPVFSTWPLGMLLAKLSFSRNGSVWLCNCIHLLLTALSALYNLQTDE